jgi:hypothetical protein
MSVIIFVHFTGPKPMARVSHQGMAGFIRYRCQTAITRQCYDERCLIDRGSTWMTTPLCELPAAQLQIPSSDSTSTMLRTQPWLC